MNIECRIKDLLTLIGKKMSLKKLEETLFLIKAEVESVEGNIIEIEVNPDRQDMLSTEGIARAVRAFLGIESGLRKYSVKKSGLQAIVKPGLSKIRPYLSCSIVHGVETDDELIKEYQENPPSRQLALTVALEIEGSAGEFHYQHAMELPADSESTKVFQELNNVDKDHASRIRGYMNATEFDDC